MAAQKVPFLSPEEYLAGERHADVKHEYIAGEAFAMAGGTPEHSHLSSDVQVALAVRVTERGCEVNNSDLMVRVGDEGPFFYPDVTATCGDPTFDADGCLRNPLLIVEVLSESTAAFDRGEKFFHYRRIPSLRHYVLIEQARMLVEHYERQENGLWTLVGEHTEPGHRLSLPALGADVPLSEVYRRVRFPAADAV